MAKVQPASWMLKLETYDKLVDMCPRFERKGKSTGYTSANGHMFSFLNKDGELGMRFSKEVQQRYFKKLNTTQYMSHGAEMKGYILIPDKMLENLKPLSKLLNESYEYVMALDPK